MFSRRTPADRSPNDWARALASLRASPGARLLDLRDSNPAAAGLSWSEEELAGAMAVAGLTLHEPAPLGLASVRRSLAGILGTRGRPVDPERLCLTASTSEGYSFLFKLLCDPGDRVLVPRPSYPLFGELAQLDAVALGSYPLRLEERWRLDLDALAAAIDERTRAVVVVHPNNPTGSRLDAAEAQALARLCAERRLALISDEVFADFPWDPADRPEPASLLATGPAEGALTFTLDGLSKSAGLPQHKLAWIAGGGPRGLLDEAWERLAHLADSYLPVSRLAQTAGVELLARSGDFRERCLARIRANLELLRALALPLLPGEAGWSAVLELPGVGDDEAFAVALLEEDGVLVHPGSFYRLGAASAAVLSLLTEPAKMAEGLVAIERRA